MPNLINRIFIPVRFIVNRLLLNIPANALSDPTTRAIFLNTADLALVSEFPAARVIPRSLRHRVIGEVLDTLIGPPRSEEIAAAAAVDPLSPLNLTPDELATLENAAPGNSVAGFMADGETADQATIEAAVASVLGAEWTVTATEPGGLTFKIEHPDSILSVAQAWELAHKLEDHAAIDLAEPAIEWVPAPAEIGGAVPNVTAIASFGGSKPLKCSESKTWTTDDFIHITAAWALSPASRQKGVGVKIGHLDSGLTAHKDLPIEGNPHILLSEGANLYDPKHKDVGDRPLDPMDSGIDDFLRTQFIDQDGHGTGTLSVLLGQAGLVRGTAPLAQVVPFRISPTVVNWNTARITEGIRRAHAAGCDVITMSMGGPEPRSKELHRVIQRAVEDGVIICTAAANVIGSNDITPIVVWPAAYDEVIAVAGSNCQREPWSGSSRGPEVNITAPAESVWRNTAVRGALPGQGVFGDKIGQGDGTSYATPATAGVAACWLAHHGGRAAITAHYGGQAKYVPRAFAHLLRTVAFDRPNGWNTRLMGSGILNAQKLLSAKLPLKEDIDHWPVKEHSLSSKALAAFLKGLGFLFGSSAAATSAAASASASPPPSAEELVARYGSELKALLLDRPALLQAFAKAGLMDADQDDGTVAVAAAAAAGEALDTTEAQAALSLLRAQASPSLAAVLPQ